MSSTRNSCASPTDRRDENRVSVSSDPQTLKMLSMPVRRAIARTRKWLIDRQFPDGSWCAELEGDTILESETILLYAFLGRVDSDLARKMAQRLVEQQLPDGGWAMYPGGKLEISGSVKAYFALKLTGHDPSAESMQRARQAILAHGGADAVNSYTRFYLAMLGQISYEQCPAVPPEVMLFPKWFPVNVYAVSAWSRTIIVPLSIISAFRPVKEIAPQLGIRELFLREPENWPPLRCAGLPGGTGLLSWDRFFRGVDGLLKWCQRRRLLPFRKQAIREAEAWMLERFKGSDGLGAIYPPIVWSIVALKCLGYADDSPEVRYNHRQLEDLVLRDEETGAIRLQPCKSPVWDTALTLRALAAGGIGPGSPPIRRAVSWLLKQQIRRPGDWSETVAAPPGGWCFEYANDFYPDVDDTAMALMALRAQFPELAPRAQDLPPELNLVDASDDEEEDWAEGMTIDLAALSSIPRPPSPVPCPLLPDEDAVATLDETVRAIDRGLKWMLAMQNKDGGWGAFDRDNDRQFLCYVPFADHNAMIDPSTPDLTGRVLECLGKLGRRVGDPAVDRAVAYLRQTQEADGSWFGRWGVNYIYGTWQSLVGLAAVGVPVNDPAIAAGANWLLAHQQAGGGWGESADTYERPHLRGQGTPTASQTAWAVMGLLAAGLADHPAVARGIRYLSLMQEEDGSWFEPEFTGTGFPKVFYLKYHYYPIYFPLLALAQWAVQVGPVLADDMLPLPAKFAAPGKIPLPVIKPFNRIIARS
ncbi:MAG: terpene cyclase/mutase family protein [Pirellulales bacterium]|nr:terpene cyclase/mutase family protein [Pirellulales bacterium]